MGFATTPIEKTGLDPQPAEEPKKLDLRQAVKSSPRGSSDRWKIQRQITLGSQEVDGEGQWGSCPTFAAVLGTFPELGQ